MSDNEVENGVWATSYAKSNEKPPNLNNFDCYEDYRDRVEAWEMTTEIKPIKMGLTLAQSLPDVSKRFGDKIATSLFKKHKARELHTVGGLQLVYAFLDEKLGKS